MKACCQATTFACLVHLLLICVTATPAPAATPEVGDATRDLVAGNVPAALKILESEGAPEPAPALGELPCKADAEAGPTHVWLDACPKLTR